MTLVKLGVACAVAACASAAIAASAMAEPPDWGRCVPSATHSGKFTGPRCTLKAPKGNGAYEFEAEPSAKPGFTGEGEEVSFETTGGHRILCAVAQAEGKYTGAKTETAKITFVGCTTKSGAASVPCRTNPAKEGEIETSELEGEIGYVTFQGKKAVALDLKGKSGGSFATYTCGTPPTVIVGTIEGSVLGRATPLNSMVEEFKVSYKGVGPGLQQLTGFEGGPTDVLKTKLVEGLGLPKEEQTALRMKYTQTNEELAELDTHA